MTLYQIKKAKINVQLTSKLFLLLSGATAIDALTAGYRMVLIDDCCRGVDLHDIEATKENILSNHGVIVQSHEVNITEIRKHEIIIN